MTAKKSKSLKSKAAPKKPVQKKRPVTATGRKRVAAAKEREKEAKRTGKRTTSAFARHKMKLLEYIADPDNPPLNRTDLAKKVLQVNRKTMYKTFTPGELAEIETEGLSLRRARLSTTSAQVDCALVRQALLGDVPAIKLYYQRFEAFSERSTLSIEPSLDDLRAFAIAKGFDPVEYIEKYQAIKAERKS